MNRKKKGNPGWGKASQSVLKRKTV